MGMGLRFQMFLFAFAALSSVGVVACKLTRPTEGNAVSAKAEIAAVSKRINEEKRYRMSDEDMALLKQNGLLNEQNKVALDTLSRK